MGPHGAAGTRRDPGQAYEQKKGRPLPSASWSYGCLHGKTFRTGRREVLEAGTFSEG